MKVKYLFLMFTFFIASLNAQNSDFAKAYYEKAQTSFENKNYKEALSFIEKSKDNAGGTNPDIIYLELKTRYHTDLKINKTKDLINQFLQNAFEDDDRRSEVSNLFIEIENSDNYYSTGLKKTITFYSKDSTKKCVKYFLMEGWSNKTICYSTATNKTTNKIFWKNKNELEREEFYYAANSKLSSVAYYINNKIAIKVDGGVSVFVYDVNENVIQKYTMRDGDYKDVIFTSYKYYNAFNDYDEYYSISTPRYNPSNLASIKAIYTYNDIVPIDSHNHIDFGVVTKTFKIYENELYIVNYNIKGVPITKEIYKRGKLKRTQSFNKSTKAWEEN